MFAFFHQRLQCLVRWEHLHHLWSSPLFLLKRKRNLHSLRTLLRYVYFWTWRKVELFWEHGRRAFRVPVVAFLLCLCQCRRERGKRQSGTIAKQKRSPHAYEKLTKISSGIWCHQTDVQWRQKSIAKRKQENSRNRQKWIITLQFCQWRIVFIAHNSDTRLVYHSAPVLIIPFYLKRAILLKSIRPVIMSGQFDVQPGEMYIVEDYRAAIRERNSHVCSCQREDKAMRSNKHEEISVNRCAKPEIICCLLTNVFGL